MTLYFQQNPLLPHHLLESITTPENTGISAALYAPSANTRLKKLGRRKATKNASAVTVDPKYFAIKISRINPKDTAKCCIRTYCKE